MGTANTSEVAGFLTPTSALPAYDDALADQLTATVVGVTGLAGTLVRPRWQPKPPKQPDRGTNWCAIGIMSIEADINPTIVHDGSGNGSSTEYRGEEMTALASFYGPNATGYASLLRDGLGIRQNQSTMLALGIAFVRTERMTAVPDLVNEEWINRVDVQLRLRRRVARTYGIENVLKVTGTITADGGGVHGPQIDINPITVG